MSKANKIAVFAGLLPFLLVWIAYIMTGFSFNAREVFQQGTFWGVSVIYWLLYVCMIGFIYDEVKN